jgi:plasmid maintenance system killer protein
LHHQDLKKSQKYFRRGLESVAAAADATVLMRLHWARYQALLADKKQRFPEPTPER